MNPPPLQLGQNLRQRASPIPIEEDVGIADVANIRDEQLFVGTENAGAFHAVSDLRDELLVADVRDIRYAYVLFDRYRARALPEILAELERR